MSRASDLIESAPPRLTSLAPQFLVEDLDRSMAYYREALGFAFGPAWPPLGGLYAIGMRDGFEIHLKKAAKCPGEREHRRRGEHLDASAGVEGIESFYEKCDARGAQITKPLALTEWGTKDFYVEDPDGYVICFGGRATS